MWLPRKKYYVTTNTGDLCENRQYHPAPQLFPSLQSIPYPHPQKRDRQTRLQSQTPRITGEFFGVDNGLRRKHLQSYLVEFVFRFNRRRIRHAAFRSQLSIGFVKIPTYAESE